MSAVGSGSFTYGQHGQVPRKPIEGVALAPDLAKHFLLLIVCVKWFGGSAGGVCLWKHLCKINDFPVLPPKQKPISFLLVPWPIIEQQTVHVTCSPYWSYLLRSREE
ncbi:hypothetical protein ILYODFUR_036102 [Ilyodon furcidens]|uniref:Uncharacterized protein n=1 Tax=Ilyodon furcidens TaxID=33524 RepID=A0ABV0U3D4_9TELE